jgi:hypothetical protein
MRFNNSKADACEAAANINIPTISRAGTKARIFMGDSSKPGTHITKVNCPARHRTPLWGIHPTDFKLAARQQLPDSCSAIVAL